MVVRIIPLLFFAIGSLVAISQVCAAETATVRFRITIDTELVENGERERDSAQKDKRMPVVPCQNAIIAFARPYTLQNLENEAVRDWARSISVPVAPRDHAFQIKDGDYFPKVMTIRAGDSLVQTKETGRMYFEGMFKNLPFGTIAQPGTKYTFTWAESNRIKVRSNPSVPRGGPSREAFLFVTDHTCVSISDDGGIAELSGLPMRGKIPMQIFYAGGKFTRKFESPTLKFKKNIFTLICEQEESVHRIHITTRKNRDEK